MKENPMPDDSAYSRYLVFFHEEVERLGPLGAIEEYIFSPQAVCIPFSEELGS